MHSAIYKGTVAHRRFGATSHHFQYSVFMMYLDLDELPGVFDGTRLWSSSRPATAWFRRQDYLPGPGSLSDAVRCTVEDATGVRPEGPIRVLTNLRYFGYLQNPITCFYCFSADGRGLEAVVLEVTNTPWGRRIAYVLRCDPASNQQSLAFAKQMHVSPFMPMDMDYRWGGSAPGEALSVQLDNYRRDERVFTARLNLLREEINPSTLRGLLLNYPPMTLKTAAAIYWQAAKLFFLKRATVPPSVPLGPVVTGG